MADTPDARRYNRIKRWLGMADAVIGFALLVVLLATGWTARLRDWSYHLGAQHYFFAVFLYVLMFSLIMKALSAPLDFYGYRVERQYNLSNQKLGAWLWDELKGWLLGLAFAYALRRVDLRHHPHRAAALVDDRMGRLCRPVPAHHAAGARRALPALLQIRAAEQRRVARPPHTAGPARRYARARRVRVEAVGKIEEGQRRTHGHRTHPADHPRRHAAAELHRRRDRGSAGARARPPRSPPHPHRASLRRSRYRSSVSGSPTRCFVSRSATSGFHRSKLACTISPTCR